MYSQVIKQISSETTFNAGVMPVLHNAKSLQRWRWITGL